MNLSAIHLPIQWAKKCLEKAGHRLIGSAGELDPTDITSLQETDLEVYSREGKLLHDDVDWNIYRW